MHFRLSPGRTRFRLAFRDLVVFCDFLGHVQQEALVVGSHFRKEPAQFIEVIACCACASPVIPVLRKVQLAH